MNNTREKIIQIIISHSLEGSSAKLKVNDVVKLAGISRQAFHRFYNDLKPYLDGSRLPVELMSETNEIRHALSLAHATIGRLNVEIHSLKESYERNLSEAINHHTTTLMNNDLALFDADAIRTNAEKQMLLIEEYRNTISQLKSQLTRSSTSLSAIHPSRIDRNYIPYDLDLTSTNYDSSPDHEQYEHLKDIAIQKIVTRLNSFQHKTLRLALFIDNYTYNFSDFIKHFPSFEDQRTCFVVRCPLFSYPEIKASILSRLTSSYFCQIFVPAPQSAANTLAHRAFFHKKVPQEELHAADNADHFFLQKGIDEVIYFYPEGAIRCLS